MIEGVIINRAPVAPHKSTDQQQQRRLRLVEIGDDGFDDLVVVARRNDDLCGAVEHL